MKAGCVNSDIGVTDVIRHDGMIVRRFDILCNSVTGSFIGPIDAGGNLGGNHIRAIWIDPLSEVDFGMAIVGNAPAVVGSDSNANITGAVSTNTPPDTLGLNPWFEWFALGSGQGMTFGVNAPLVMDITGSLFIVPRQAQWGATTGSPALAQRARFSVAVAWGGLPDSFPSGRAPIQATSAGNPNALNPMVIRLPSMSRKAAVIMAQNADAGNVLNIKVRLFKAFLSNQGPSTVLSAGIAIPAGNGQANIWDLKDFFPTAPMPDWVQVEATGPSTSAFVSLELKD